MAQWIRFERGDRLEFGTLQGGEIIVDKGDMFAGASPTRSTTSARRSG